MPASSLRLKCFVSGAFILGIGLARAQEAVTIPRVTRTEEIWPVGGAWQDRTLLVVSSAKPTVRQKCRVESISVDELVCARRFGRKSVSFRERDVVALIRPANHDSRLELPIFLGFFSAGGAIVYSAAVIASVATPLLFVAIPVALIGGIMAIGSPVLFIGATDSPESVLYLRPGSQLRFALRQ
jgi:hypothetical protein